MMNYLRLLVVLIKINLQMALAYRADTLLNIGINLMWLGWELLSLNIIFNNTTTLAGWGIGEMVTLLGVFRLVNLLMTAIIWPATEKFNASVRDGSLDYTLLQPANSLFLVTFSRIILWRVWDLLLAVVLVVVGISLSGGVPAWGNLLAFLALMAAGGVVIYSLWVVLIAMTFWFVKFDNNVTILQALMDSGRYPAAVYPPWLRLIVTFIVPIALATSVPVQGLSGEVFGWNVIGFIAIGAAALWIARRVWQAGVQRYSGASS